MTSLLIGIDGDALRSPLSGVGHYIFNLARELDELLPEASFIAYSRLPAGNLKLPSTRWRLQVNRWRRFAGCRLLFGSKHAAAPCAPPTGSTYSGLGEPCTQDLRVGCGPSASVHDLNHLVVPETMQFQSRWSSRLWFRPDVLAADCVLANSEGTAERLRSMIGAKVHDVVRPGVSPQFQPSHQSSEMKFRPTLSRLGVKKPYLLSVATPEPRKNLDAVLGAFIELKRAGSCQNISWCWPAPPVGKTGR